MKRPSHPSDGATRLSQTDDSSQRLAAIVESSDDAIIGKNLDGVVTSWNAGAQRIFGYPAAEMIGTSILRLIPADRHHEESLILEKIRRGETLEHFETVRQTREGRLIQVSVTASPIKDAGGRVVGVSKVARDITGRRQAEDRYRTLFDYAPDGILIADGESNYRDANPSICRMLGYSREELIGMHASDIVTESENPHIEAALEVIHAGDPYHREWHFRRKDGTVFPAEVIATRMPDGMLLGMVRDISERKRLEQQILRAQRMESIGTLAGGIAHDLNNVLAPILLSVDLLDESVTDPEGRSTLAMLRGRAEHGAELVKQVLSFARGVKGQRIPVNPVHLMNDLVKVVRDTFPKTIRVQLTAAHGLWALTGDPTQLHQVFLNLCVNARDAMPDGGILTIQMENGVLDETYTAMNPDAQPGSYLVVKVMDTGIGIPADVRDRIFEPFFTTKELGSGTGLGLSTTLAIIKSHGGFVHVYSEPDHGATFTVHLPANTTQAAMEEVAVEQARMPRGNGETVLVVDDEEVVRTIVQRALTRYGYRVVMAANGAEAVALYAQQGETIALVLTDMAMPVMDGAATVVALRALNPAVKIIGSSGLSSGGEANKAIGAGVLHFVSKPYTAELLLKTIHQVLQEP